MESLIVLSLQYAPYPFLTICATRVRGLKQNSKALEALSNLRTTVSLVVVHDEVRFHAAVRVPKLTSELHHELLELGDIGATGDHVVIAPL